MGVSLSECPFKWLHGKPKKRSGCWGVPQKPHKVSASLGQMDEAIEMAEEATLTALESRFP